MRSFAVTREVLRHSEEALRRAGRNGDELFVLWAGQQDGARFRVRSVYVPTQTAQKTPDGVCVIVEGDELHKLNRWLFEVQEILAVQIHTHPKSAYHSETDDRYPIVTELGGASLVVPDFGRRGVLCDRSALYRLTTRGWQRTRANVSDVILVV